MSTVLQMEATLKFDQERNSPGCLVPISFAGGLTRDIPCEYFTAVSISILFLTEVTWLLVAETNIYWIHVVGTLDNDESVHSILMWLSRRRKSSRLYMANQTCWWNVEEMVHTVTYLYHSLQQYDEFWPVVSYILRYLCIYYELW